MRRRMVGFCSTLEYTYIPIYTGEIKRRRVGGRYHTSVHLYTHLHRGDKEEAGGVGGITLLYTCIPIYTREIKRRRVGWGGVGVSH